MKVLVLSDIHDSVKSIRRLRKQESNGYDAIIVAGDIGNSYSTEIYSIFDTFKVSLLLRFWKLGFFG